MATHARAGRSGLALALALCAALALTLRSAGARAPSALVLERAPAPREVRGRAVPQRAHGPDEVGRPGPSAPLRPTGTERAPHRASREAPRARAPLATLVGRITRDGRGTPARLLLARGWSEGTVVETSADGGFRSAALGPGFHLVTVTVEGRPPCTRRLFLAPYAETTLELDVGVPRARTVRVLDPAGRPLPGAAVELDGAGTRTDAGGRAALTWSASGRPELVVRAPGCALHAQALDPLDAEQELTVRLQAGCALELELPADAAGDVLVHLLPREPGPLAGSPPRPATPWYLVSPLRLTPGAAVRVDGLPAGALEVRALYPDLSVSPARVRLDPDLPRELAIGGASSAPRHEQAGGDVLDTIRALGDLPRLQPLARPRDAHGRPD